MLENLCTATNTANSNTHVSLPRGALLAIFDHASTYSMAVADKWGRPVSESTKTCREYLTARGHHKGHRRWECRKEVVCAVG